MSRRRKPGRNRLFDSLAGPAVAAGYTLSDAPGRTVEGTVLTRWMYSISDGRTVPDCGHAVPGRPALLSADDPQPVIRCMACVPALAGIRDDGVCHLCGREPAVFREFSVTGAGQLVITGNACDQCFADIFRGKAGPRQGGDAAAVDHPRPCERRPTIPADRRSPRSL